MSEEQGVRDGFLTFEIESGLRLEAPGEEHPARVWGCCGETLRLPADGTHFIILGEGEASVESAGRPAAALLPGMFCVAPGAARIVAPHGRALVITQVSYHGLWQAGGPPESRGRLRYIDGCSDTLLVCPPRLGEACLNHLHVPPGTRQSAHTHPSVRIGTIVGGTGECRTPEGNRALRAGMGWLIPAGLVHSFHTDAQCLDVIAWHPDSDFGPTDESHPMRNRTLL